MQELQTAPPADLRIAFSVSREEYTAGLRDTMQLLLRCVRWGNAMYFLAALSVVCGITIGMAYIELINGYIGRYWRLQWLMVVAFFGICLLTIWQQRLREARIYATCAEDDSMVLGSQVLEITANALHHEGRGMVAQVAWTALKHIAQGQDTVLIVLKNYTFMVIPQRAFSSAQQRGAWIAALRAHAPGAAWDAVPAPARTRVPGAPSIDTQLAQPVSALSPLTLGLRENFRAGTRLAFFRRVESRDFVATAEAFIALATMELVVMLAFDIAGVGIGVSGQMDREALPHALLFVPLTLLLGVAAARRTGDRSLLLALPVALVAAGLVVSLVSGMLGILLQHQAIVLAARHWAWLFYVQLAWWSAIICFVLWRFAPMQIQRGAGLALLGVALLAAPSLWYPANHLWIPADKPERQSDVDKKYFALADEKGYHAQQDMLPRTLSALLPQRPGIADLYVLSAGLYAREDVFMKEVRMIDTLLRQRFDADGRALMLINNPQTVHDVPIASSTNLSAALRHIGGLMNPEEDVLVLYLSSHGSEKHHLAVDFWPLQLKPIDPPALKKALDESKIQWKIVVVSACYSGGFIEPLKDAYTLIITASSATRTSFGCGSESNATYLAQALFDEALRKTYSFETAFEQARQSIHQREQAQGHEPSAPQIFVGAAIREKLLQVERRLAQRNQ